MAQVLILLFLTTSLFAEFAVKSISELKYNDVIKQSFEESCGASAMATLLNLDGNNFTEKELLSDLNTTDVVSLYALEMLAKNLSYQSKSYKIDEKILKTLKYPVIARVARDKDYPHFIVIKMKEESVIILDSNNGKYSISIPAFIKIWTKHILIVAPKKSFEDIKTIDITKFGYLLDFR